MHSGGGDTSKLRLIPDSLRIPIRTEPITHLLSMASSPRHMRKKSLTKLVRLFSRRGAKLPALVLVLSTRGRRVLGRLNSK
ncbi:hypothetical protein AEQ27_09980 [Frigoribacterium sp. RIT-PI-h]|nr:hypothetical protein AEQ27_09980 [Frigoribacterium sp. RIT-PI-h]